MTRRTVGQWVTGLVPAALAVCVGCLGTHPRFGEHRQTPPIVVPPAGSVPTELNAVSLPEYVIEPPDTLLIEAVRRTVSADYKKELADLEKELTDRAKPPTAARKSQIEARIEELRAKPEYDGQVEDLPYQPVRNSTFQVQPDGFVYLGVYGSIPVSGLTVNQVRQMIRSTLARQIEGGTREEAILVNVSVTGYNSKVYYVITDGGGAGERVAEFPITGKEFVTTAITRVGGLSEVSSKRNIWVARRTPQLSQDQILPVDWVGITQWGVTTTNYQLFPGDRVYVKAQRLVTVETTLSRVLAPVKELFGVTLLGTQTVNQINGRGFGFGGTGVR
jgi:polysaccharide export outer membrane protein